MNLACSKPKEGQFVMVLLEAFEPNALPTYLRKNSQLKEIKEEKARLEKSKQQSSTASPLSTKTSSTTFHECGNDSNTSQQDVERSTRFRKYKKPNFARSSVVNHHHFASGSNIVMLSPVYNNSHNNNNKQPHNNFNKSHQKENEHSTVAGPFLTEIIYNDDDDCSIEIQDGAVEKRPPKLMENYIKQREYDDYLHTSLQRRSDIYTNGKEKKTASFSRVKANTLSKAPPSLPSLSHRNLFTTPTCGQVSLDSVKPSNLKVGLVLECKEKDAIITTLFKDGVFLHYFNLKETIPYNRLVVLTNDEYKILLGEAWMERLIEFEMGTSSKAQFSFSPNKISDTKSKDWMEMRKKMMTALNKLKKRRGFDDESLKSPTMQDLMRELEDGNEDTFLETYREGGRGAPNRFHKVEEEEEQAKIFTLWNDRLESFHALRMPENSVLSQKRTTTLRDLSESLSNKMGHLIAYEEAVLSAFQTTTANDNSNEKPKRGLMVPSLNSSLMNSSQASNKVSHNSLTSPRTPRTFFLDHLSGKLLPGKVVFIDPISLILNIIVTYSKKPIVNVIHSPRMMNSPRSKTIKPHGAEVDQTASIMIYLYLDKISFNVEGENTASTAYGPLTTKLIGKQVLVYIPMTTVAITNVSYGKEINTLDTSLPCDIWLVSDGDDCLKSTQMIKKDILSIDLPERIWINKWVVEQGLAALHCNQSDSRIEEHNLTSISKPYISQQMKVLRESELFAKNHDVGIWGFKNQQIKLEKERERIQRWKFRTGKGGEKSKNTPTPPPKDQYTNEGSLFRGTDRKYMIEFRL